jgi:GNAT superfamily N-acetyltransferase
VAIAFEGETPIGAILAQPMVITWDVYHKPLIDAGYDLKPLFFIGELVVLPNYRKQNVATKLYKQVETYAKTKNFSTLALYSQVEDLTHPLKPQNYTSIDPFWVKQGFIKHPELNLSIQWDDIQGNFSTFHMIYWLKSLH